MKYLITGAAGFIGSHLADHLLKEGHDVIGLDNLSTGRLENVEHLNNHKHFDLTVDSILNPNVLSKLVKNADIVIHLAAAVGVKLIMEKPVETIRTNILGTEEVLRFASLYRKKILIASSSEVYGKIQDENNDIIALKENDDTKMGPTSKRRWAYAASKSIDEFLGLAYYEEKNLPTVIVRFFNTVGPRQTGRYGMVIPRFVRRALLNEPLQIYGDGSQRRCFTYVGDAITGIVQLIHTKAAEGQIFNLGSIKEITINDLADTVKKVTGSHSEITHVPYEEVYGHGFEDMKRRTPDISKLQATIHFEPTKTIDEIVEIVADYMRRK